MRMVMMRSKLHGSGKKESRKKEAEKEVGRMIISLISS